MSDDGAVARLNTLNALLRHVGLDGRGFVCNNVRWSASVGAESDFRRVTQERGGAVLIIIITVDSPIEINDHTFSSPLLEVPGTAAILWFKGSVTKDLVDYIDILIVSCDPLDSSALIGLLQNSFQNATVTSANAELARLYQLEWQDSEDIHAVKLPRIYTGSTHEISFMLGREDVTIESRALSLMALMFPYARDYIVSKGVVRTVRAFLDSKNLHLPPSSGLHAETRRQ